VKRYSLHPDALQELQHQALYCHERSEWPPQELKDLILFFPAEIFTVVPWQASKCRENLQKGTANGGRLT